MANSTDLPLVLSGVSAPFSGPTIALTLGALLLIPAIFKYMKADRIPLINPPGFFQLSLQKKVEFSTKGVHYFFQGRERHPGKPFKLLTNNGVMTILPPEKAHEIRNLETLDFRKGFCDTIPIGLPGGQAMHVPEHPGEILQKVCMRDLTKRLDTFNEALASETSFAIEKNFGNSAEWTTAPLYMSVVDIIVRQSARIFSGQDLARNEEWLHITKHYTVAATQLFTTMRGYPSLLRVPAYWLSASGKSFRDTYARAQQLLNPMLAARQQERQKCARSGTPQPVYDDAFGWLEREGGTIEPVDFQLAISFAAIHTTSDLLAQTMLCLAANPACVDELREEMLRVLPVHGLKKTGLSALRLLDSAIKESQRLKPLQIVTMQRLVMAKTTLSDGTTLRKDERVAIDATKVWDESKHPNPKTFDPHRFNNNDPKSSLVSAAADHLAWGYGKYVCPGRFFAANEIKIALCHLLLKYDWKLEEGSALEPFYIGTDPMVNPFAKFVFRRRAEEVDLGSLQW
ncbi:hypothetical protein MCOR25_008203 [Pyricularia grisea]|nr:hypothetical protein MCOR25_008203 [Pyricularia grisea]